MSTDTAISIGAERLAVITREIHELEKEGARCIYEMGVRLTEVKHGLEHGQWLDWLENNFSMSVSTAENLINVVKRFSAEFVTKGTIPTTILYMLSAPSTPDIAITNIVERIQSGVNITREQASTMIEAGKRVESAPDSIRERVASGELSLLDGAQLTQTLNTVSERVQVVTLKNGVSDPQVIQFLSFIEKEHPDMLDEIEATGYIQATDPIKLSEANIRDAQSALGETRFEEHVRSEIVKSEPVLDADFIITEVDSTGLNFTMRVDTTSSLIQEGFTGRVIIKPKTRRSKS